MSKLVDAAEALWTWPTFKQFPTPALVQAIGEAYFDSFFLALQAYNYAADDSMVLLRYFRNTDAKFVRKVFEELFEPGFKAPSTSFAKLTIWFGANPAAHDLCHASINALGYLTEYPDDPDQPADLILCPRAMLLPQRNSVHCDQLSQHIDSSFQILTGVLVHEVVHWRRLVAGALKMKDPPQVKIRDFTGPGSVYWLRRIPSPQGARKSRPYR